MDYKVQKKSQNNDMASLVNDVCNIIETGRKEAYVAAGKSAVITYCEYRSPYCERGTAG